jgi:hypothetical protein
MATTESSKAATSFKPSGKGFQHLTTSGSQKRGYHGHVSMATSESFKATTSF